MYRTVLAACLGLLCTGVQELAAPVFPGSICGFVLDENGAPAAFTRVTAIYLGPHSGPFDRGTTDGGGHYCVRVRFGTYAMSAEDDAKGYPLLSSTFYTEHAPGAEIEVTAAAPSARADWRIPYKAGFLHVELKDAKTGRPIDSMFLNLDLRSDPTDRFMHMSSSSSRVVLVPSK